MNEETFMNLVKDNNGFEFVIGFKNFIDHHIGGLGNKYWYYIDYDGKKAEYYIGTYEDGKWSDKFYTKKGSKLESKTIDSGTTIKMIVERAYFYNEKVATRKAQEIEKHGYMLNHYMIGFGEKAVETSQEYGVTVCFNDINNNDSAYELREILIGEDVDKPKEN